MAGSPIVRASNIRMSRNQPGALPGPPGAAFPPEFGRCGKGPQTVTAYYHLGWWSIIGYAIAAVIAVAGFALAFRDLS